jgi:hypothetical protein
MDDGPASALRIFDGRSVSGPGAGGADISPTGSEGPGRLPVVHENLVCNEYMSGREHTIHVQPLDSLQFPRPGLDVSALAILTLLKTAHPVPGTCASYPAYSWSTNTARLATQ